MARTTFMALLLFASVFVQQDVAQGKIRMRKACEGHTAYLNCPRGFKILVFTAFYGLGPDRMCSGPRSRSRGHKCRVPGTIKLLRHLCNRRTECRVKVNSHTLGNSKDCLKKDKKYIRVQYFCQYGKCKKVRKLHDWLVYKAKHIRELVHYGSIRNARVHNKEVYNRLIIRLNRLRKRYRSCFKCHRGCSLLAKQSQQLYAAREKLHALLMHHHRGWSQRWHVTPRYLRRKLLYLRRRHRLVRKSLRHCLSACFYQ